MIISAVLLLTGTMNFVFAVWIDPAWAGPINTALFVLLAYVNYRIGKQTKDHAKELEDVKRKANTATKVAKEAKKKVETDGEGQ